MTGLLLCKCGDVAEMADGLSFVLSIDHSGHNRSWTLGISSLPLLLASSAWLANRSY